MPAAVGPGATKLVCQHFVADPAIESYIVVADAEGTGPTVYVEFYNDQGELAGQTKVDIPKFGKFSIQPLALVGNKKMTGVAFIQTEGGKITGEYWQVSQPVSRVIGIKPRRICYTCHIRRITHI